VMTMYFFMLCVLRCEIQRYILFSLNNHFLIFFLSFFYHGIKKPPGMTDRREHISTNNRFKIKQLCDNRKGSYTLPTCFYLPDIDMKESGIQANASNFKDFP
jgi:hypothetical protein